MHIHCINIFTRIITIFILCVRNCYILYPPPQYLHIIPNAYSLYEFTHVTKPTYLAIYKYIAANTSSVLFLFFITTQHLQEVVCTNISPLSYLLVYALHTAQDSIYLLTPTTLGKHNHTIQQPLLLTHIFLIHHNQNSLSIFINETQQKHLNSYKFMTANASSIVFLQTYRSSMSYSIPKKTSHRIYFCIYHTQSKNSRIYVFTYSDYSRNT